jgi:hypothetical protein
MEGFILNKVYKLKTDSENYARFIEQRDNLDSSFTYKYWEWKHIDLETYQPVKLKLYRSDTGKKNFQTDIVTISGHLIILSEKAVNVLKDILDKTGQIIPVETESKRKKFYGFYPNKNVYDSSVINWNKSKWEDVEKDNIIRKSIKKLVLNSNYPKDDYLFTLFDERMTVYVTDKFKELVEKNGLLGFDFSREIEISD